MLRRVGRLAFLLGLLLSVAKGTAWVLSYVRPSDYQLLYRLHPSWILTNAPDGRPAGAISRQDDPSLPTGYWRAWYMENRRGRVFILHHDVDFGTTGGIWVDSPNKLFSFNWVGVGGTKQPRGVLSISARNPADGPRKLWEHAGFGVTDHPWEMGNATNTNAGKTTLVMLPHWLLVVLCLAWPVTSFIIARRRGKRGFPVIQTEVSGQKSEVS